MIKRAFSCLVVFALLVVSAQFVRAEKSVKYDELSICRRVFAYSGNSSAYLYGFYEKTICSARVVPDDSARKATVPGNVLAVCHDEDNLCALYSSGYEKFGAARLNINSGRLYYREIVSGKNVQFSSIAEADGELFLIIVENGVSFVTGYTENSNYTYRFEADVRQLFVNDSRAYALTIDKRVFRLSKGEKSFCCQMPDNGTVTDAGRGYVYTSGRSLVNLAGGVQYIGSKLAVKVNGSIIKSDKDMLIAASGDKFASLNKDYSCTVKDINDKAEGSSFGSSPRSIGDIIICAQGTTVKAFKDKYPGAILRGRDNSELTAGKLRTGDRAVFSGNTGEIVVTGDIDGSATVTGEDVRTLMKSMTDSAVLSACEREAADMNRDNELNNRDLVLLARAAS